MGNDTNSAVEDSAVIPPPPPPPPESATPEQVTDPETGEEVTAEDLPESIQVDDVIYNQNEDGTYSQDGTSEPKYILNKNDDGSLELVEVAQYHPGVHLGEQGELGEEDTALAFGEDDIVYRENPDGTWTAVGSVDENNIITFNNGQQAILEGYNMNRDMVYGTSYTAEDGSTAFVGNDGVAYLYDGSNSDNSTWTEADNLGYSVDFDTATGELILTKTDGDESGSSGSNRSGTYTSDASGSSASNTGGAGDAEDAGTGTGTGTGGTSTTSSSPPPQTIDGDDLDEDNLPEGGEILELDMGDYEHTGNDGGNNSEDRTFYVDPENNLYEQDDAGDWQLAGTVDENGVMSFNNSNSKAIEVDGDMVFGTTYSDPDAPESGEVFVSNAGDVYAKASPDADWEISNEYEYNPSTMLVTTTDIDGNTTTLEPTDPPEETAGGDTSFITVGGENIEVLPPADGENENVRQGTDGNTYIRTPDGEWAQATAMEAVVEGNDGEPTTVTYYALDNGEVYFAPGAAGGDADTAADLEPSGFTSVNGGLVHEDNTVWSKNAGGNSDGILRQSQWSVDEDSGLLTTTGFTNQDGDEVAEGSEAVIGPDGNIVRLESAPDAETNQNVRQGTDGFTYIRTPEPNAEWVQASAISESVSDGDGGMTDVTYYVLDNGDVYYVPYDAEDDEELKQSNFTGADLAPDDNT